MHLSSVLLGAARNFVGSRKFTGHLEKGHLICLASRDTVRGTMVCKAHLRRRVALHEAVH